MKTEVLDHGYVELIESWGSDQRIIKSARMSTNKGFLGWGPKPEHSEDCLLAERWKIMDCKCPEKPGDEKLLKYLWDNKHHTPFEQAGFTVEVQAPIFVIREWHRHRTQSYNELSARYTELPNLFYIPDANRILEGSKPNKNKQASGTGLTIDPTIVQAEIELIYKEARSTYEDLLKNGVAREIARIVIPVAQYSRMVASANLRNWLGFLTLRTAENAQWEIRQYAYEVAKIVKLLYPRTFKLWEKER